MYEAFYGFNEKPFNLTPDPRFLYLSAKHEEALAHLLYGIQNRSGFVMVSGEIGTGKTTICRSLLKKLDSDTEVAYIFNPKLSPEELLRTINEDFGIATEATTVRGLIDELNTYLLKQTADGKNCVIIIDEAQNLGTETLEQVRLLSNLETDTEKLLQIVLIGQPELPEKLELPELRQLNQRITARYHLNTLNKSETLHYIAFRLQVAGGRKRVRFTRGAVRRIYKISRGTPRIINAICDRALLIGYTKETREITPPIIRQAAREVRGDTRNRDLRFRLKRLAPASVVVAVGGVLLAVVLLLTSGPLPSISDAGGFAQSQWKRVVATMNDTISLANTSQADTDGGGPGGLEGGVSSPSAADPKQISQGRAVEAPGGVAATLQQSKPSSSKVAEAATRTAARGKPKPGHEASPAPSQGTGTTGLVSESAPDAASSSREALQEFTKAPRSVRDAMRGPLSSILKAWGLAAPSNSPLRSIEDVRGYALSNNLSFAGRSLSLNQAVAINLPFLALVRRGLEENWMAVLAIENGDVRVSSGTDAPENLAIEEFKTIFSREVAYVWLDYQPGATPLRARSGGAAVWELQNGLQTLGLLDREPTGVYDATTIEVVSKIQRATGLLVDGIVGPQTRMVLGNWLQEYPVRVLAKPAFSDTARARVLSSNGMVLATREVAGLLPVPEDPAASKGGPAPSKGANSLQGLEPATGGVSSQPAEPSWPEEEASDAPDDGETTGFETAQGQRQRNEGTIVSIEELDQPGYRPQLDFDSAFLEDSITPSAGPNVPIVPSDLLQGER